MEKQEYKGIQNYRVADSCRTCINCKRKAQDTGDCILAISNRVALSCICDSYKKDINTVY